MRYFYFTLFTLIFYQNLSFADEVIQDINGNYFIIKDDGTFVKLPPPKPGYKYTIQKKKLKKKLKEIKCLKDLKKKQG